MTIRVETVILREREGSLRAFEESTGAGDARSYESDSVQASAVDPARLPRVIIGMLDQLAQRLGVSTSVTVVILALILVQLALQIYALADLARRDVVLGDRKWVWTLVIAFGNLVGALVYLFVGRRAPPAELPGGASTASSDAAKRAVDSLYGPRDRP